MGTCRPLGRDAPNVEIARELASIGARGPQVVARERFLGQFARLSCGKSLHRALPRPRCLLAKLVGRSRIPSALGASRGARVSTLPPLLERRTRCRCRGTVTAVACPHPGIFYRMRDPKTAPNRAAGMALATQLHYIRAGPPVGSARNSYRFTMPLTLICRAAAVAACLVLAFASTKPAWGRRARSRAANVRRSGRRGPST